MPWIDYRDLRRRLDVEEVLSWMGWHATERRNDNLRESCPICGADNSPLPAHSPPKGNSRLGREFAIHRDRKLYYCFRCKQGGNILDLWSRYNRIDLNAAAIDLSNRLCTPSTPKSSNQQSQQNQPPI